MPLWESHLPMGLLLLDQYKPTGHRHKEEETPLDGMARKNGVYPASGKDKGGCEGRGNDFILHLFPPSLS